MNRRIRFNIISILLVFTLLFSLCACKNIDPNKKSNTDSESDTNLAESGSISEIDVDFFALRGYELCILLAQSSFESPDQIPINALVQFAMCHLFYDDLTKMPTTGMQIRTATVPEIEEKIKEYFGEANIDVTKSDLYNKGKQIFEMWEPHYGGDVYYTASANTKIGGLFEVKVNYYKDSAKTDSIGNVIVTLIKKNGKFYIKGANLI